MTLTAEPRLRIALTVDPELPVPPTLYGGIERVVDMLARRLMAEGHHITLFAHPASSCPVPLVPWRGLKSGSAADTLRNATTLARHAAAGRFDLVHSFSRLAYLAPILPLGLPKLMTYQRLVSPRTTALAHRLSRGTLSFSAVSRRMIGADRLRGRWSVVPNGVPLARYPFRAEVAADSPLIFLGRLEDIKGPDLAIAVARRSGVPLVLAGNVPEHKRAWFEAEVAPHVDGERVRYVGPVDDARKAELLGRSRALLMPIRWDEPFGIVMAEAMACGTPVIGLRRGSVPEVVADGVTGFVTGDVEGMVDAVQRLPEVRRQACRDRAERLFGDAAVAAGYLDLYRRSLDGPAP